MLKEISVSMTKNTQQEDSPERYFMSSHKYKNMLQNKSQALARRLVTANKPQRNISIP